MLFNLIGFASLLLQFFLPWWVIAPLAFIFSLWKARSGGHAFKSGFFAIAILWAVVAFIHTLENEHILANRVGRMFMLPDWNLNWLIMLLLTAIVGGLTAGLSALAGYYSRKALRKD